MKKVTALILALILIAGTIPAMAKTEREVWVPSPYITSGVTSDEIMVNKAIHMGGARLYKLDSIGDKYYLAVLEEKFSDGGTNGNRKHSYLTYYSLLETDNNFIILGKAYLGNEYVQDYLEEVVDISDSIDVAYYEKHGCEAPMYVINPNGKYICLDWDEYEEFVFIGSNGGIACISDCMDYGQARSPLIYENKFYTAKYKYYSSDRSYFYYLEDGKTKAAVLDLCGIKNGELVTVTSSKVAATTVSDENGYNIFVDQNCEGNTNRIVKFLISSENNLYLTCKSFLNEATGVYDCNISVNQIINGVSTPVSSRTFSTGKTSKVSYVPTMISGLDKEAYTTKNMDMPVAVIENYFISENGNIYEFVSDGDYSSKNLCVYNGMVSYIRTYIDGAYLYYPNDSGVYKYWQRINQLNFKQGKATASDDIDFLVGEVDNLDGYFSSYKNFVACSLVNTATASKITSWWPHCYDNKFSDGRYVTGHWVANESGSYEMWYDIYSEDGTKVSTGPSGYSLGASSVRYCPSIRAFVINNTKIIMCLNDLEYDWMEEYYRASVVTENDDGIIEVPMPIGKKNIVSSEFSDTIPTESVVDFAADDLKLGFNVKENILGTDKLTPELREQVNTIRLDGIVIVAKDEYISGKQNTGVTLSEFNEYDYTFGETPVRFYSNGQYLCWYCDNPEELNAGTYNVNYPVGDLTVCAIVKIITPPTNNSSTTVVF